MSWSDKPPTSSNDGSKKKNPWGKPDDNVNRGPWGNTPPRKGGGGSGGGSGNGGEPPDIDEMLRRAQANFRQIFPNSPMEGGKMFILGGAALVALWLASGLYTIQPGENGVIQRFGAWSRTHSESGLGYHLPAPIETIQKVNIAEVRRMEIGFSARGRGNTGKQDIPDESLMLTSDANIVDLDLVVLWTIKSAEDYLFNIKDQENTIKRVAESAIREAVGQTPMFSIITGAREQVAQKAKEIMVKNLDEYKSGINVMQVLIQQAEVHPDVQSAFQDVQSAKQDAEDVQNQAGAYREDILPKARGEAIKMTQDAKGYKESIVAKAKGDAERFNSVYQAYLTGQDVTKERIFIETMESVLKNAQKTILDNNTKGSGVLPYLSLNQIKPAAGNETAMPQPQTPEFGVRK
jgi:membrane protease subunit HflK